MFTKCVCNLFKYPSFFMPFMLEPLREKIFGHLNTIDIPKALDALGAAGLFVCGFGIFSKKSIAHTGFLLMALSLALTFKSVARRFVRDRLFVLSVSFLILIVVGGILAALEFQQKTPLIVQGTLKLAGAGFFGTLVFAHCLNRIRGRWDALVMVILAGYFVQLLRNTDWSNLSGFIYRIWSGAERATFGFSTNRFGFFSAIVLLACLVMYREIWGGTGGITRYGVRIASWVLMSGLSLAGIIFSQSRSTWISSVLILPAALAFRLFREKKIHPGVLVAATAAFVLFAYAANLPKFLERRFIQETGTALARLLDADDRQPAGGAPQADSISERLLIYRLFYEKWSQRPLFGYGPGASEILIKSATGEYAPIARLGHFHNSSFDILAQAGVVGWCFYAVFLYFVFKQVFESRREYDFEKGYRLFATAGILLFTLNGIVSQPLSSVHGIYLFALLTGICYSARFRSQPTPPPGVI